MTHMKGMPCVWADQGAKPGAGLRQVDEGLLICPGIVVVGGHVTVPATDAVSTKMADNFDYEIVAKMGKPQPPYARTVRFFQDSPKLRFPNPSITFPGRRMCQSPMADLRLWIGHLE